jgi:hypothetical protein
MSEVTEVFTIRISKELKELMKASQINWSDDIRKYIEARAKSLRLHKLLTKIYKDADRIRIKGDSSMLVREDREGR